jgi:protein SCO1/2
MPQQGRSPVRIRTLVALAIAAMLGVVEAPDWTLRRSSASAAPSEAAAGPGISGEFELVDQTGRTVHDGDFRGTWRLVFFGYTHCPDICPATLMNVTAALEELGSATDRLRALFVTVDPRRDTPAVLRAYLAEFDPRILGLTGTSEQVGAALRNFHVYAAKVPLDGDNYVMEHSSFIYLMDREGRYAAHFPAQLPVEELVAKLRARLGSAVP